MQVPNSSGTAGPKLPTPANACDCHMHVYDGARFPPARPGARMQPDAAVPDYRLLQKRIGTTRTVVVQPAAYVTDNEVTLDALAQLGKEARGVAVVQPGVSDADLKRMADGGICGIRFTQFDPKSAATTRDMIEPLAKRVEPLGWHVQIHLRCRSDRRCRRHAATAAGHRGVRSPRAARGRRERSGDGRHPAHARPRPHLDEAFRRLYVRRAAGLCRGAADRARIYRGSARADGMGQRLAASDGSRKPDDAVLLDLVAEWAGDEALRKRILVDNPAKLYGF